MFNKMKLLAVVFVLFAFYAVGSVNVAGAMAAPTGQGPILAAVGPNVHLIPPIMNDSFSIDAASLLSTAASIFNALWPIFGILVGIILGIGLVTLIVSEIRKAI